MFLIISAYIPNKLYNLFKLKIQKLLLYLYPPPPRVHCVWFFPSYLNHYLKLHPHRGSNPFLRKNREYFLACSHKCLRCKPVGGSGGMPPRKFCKLSFSQVAFPALFLTSFLWYSITRPLFLSQISLGFSLLLLIHHFRIKQGDFFHFFYTMATSHKCCIQWGATMLWATVILSSFVANTSILNLLYRLLAF